MANPPLNEGTVPAAVPADLTAELLEALQAMVARFEGHAWGSEEDEERTLEKARVVIAKVDAALATSAPPPTDATEQALGLYFEQAEAIRELLDQHAPNTTGNLQARIAQVLSTSAPPPVEAGEPVAFRMRSPSGTTTLLTEDAPLAADMLQRGWEVQPLVPGGWGEPPSRAAVGSLAEADSGGEPWGTAGAQESHPKEPTEARGAMAHPMMGAPASAYRASPCPRGAADPECVNSSFCAGRLTCARTFGMQVKEPTEARGDGVKEPSCAALELSYPGDTDLRWCYRCGEGVIPGMCRASKARVGEVDRG